MKKFISIIVLFSLFAPFWISFSVYQIEKRIIAKSVKKILISQIDKKDLVLLKFLRKDVQKKVNWEHSKEFEYNGTMFDIVESVTVSDSIYYWCWQDDNETDLNKRFIAFVTSSLEKNANANKLFSQLNSFSSIYYISNNINCLLTSIRRENKYHIDNFINYKNHILNPDYPPPKC